ncbi:MAG: hypothetical protein EON99_00205 [Chitinophagaceae bacterium]|nr:MAG: hypothetical protein EON99_00205 [Chitinophagaceae bacterium]
MNTESMNTLKIVRDTINLVQQQMEEGTWNKAEKKSIAATLRSLDTIENVIVNETLMKMVDELNASNTQLTGLIEDMEKASAKIEKISTAVKRVSKVIGVLAEITKKAIAVGIL